MKKPFKILGISAILALMLAFLLEVYVQVEFSFKYGQTLNDNQNNVVLFVEAITAICLLGAHIFQGVKCTIDLFENKSSKVKLIETFVSFAFLDAIYNLAFTVVYVSTGMSLVSDPYIIASLVIFSLTFLVSFICKFMKKDSGLLNLICVVLFLGLIILGFFEVKYEEVGKELNPTVGLILPIIETISLLQVIVIASFSIKNEQ